MASWCVAARRSLVMAGLAGAMLGGQAPAQDEAAFRWRQIFPRALAEAQHQRLPLLVCFNTDGDCDSKTAPRDLYGHKTLRREALVVPVIGSPDSHGDADGVCPRFGDIRCVDHQACYAAARRHLFGKAPGVISPQHVILYPDGEVAWHKLYQCKPAEIARALRDARTGLRKGPRYRLQQQQKTLRRLVVSAHRDHGAFHRALTLLAHASNDQFAELWKLVRNKPCAGRLLCELAALPTDRSAARLAMVARSSGDRAADLAQRLYTEIQAQPPRRGAACAKRITEPLPSLGEAESLDDVMFYGRAKPSIEAGKITVLWFFLPDWDQLPTYVKRFSGFADELRDRGVRMIGLGATINPHGDAVDLANMPFTFPAGAYRYQAARALYGFQLFPAVVILDPDRQIVYRSNHYSEFEGVVRGMLRLPEYRAKMTPTRE